MTADDSPVPPPDAPAAPTKSRPLWPWITASVVLLVVALGLGVWALGMQGDLDDANAQAEQAQQANEEVVQESEDLTQQVDDLTNMVNENSDRLDQALSDAQ